jgi:hypothetical protein
MAPRIVVGYTGCPGRSKTRVARRPFLFSAQVADDRFRWIGHLADDARGG